MSSNGANIPYLGSKISLISKAKIRYEGILYTIDPQESTVALAKVRSYGTENRPVENPLPPKDEVYEYIIFRAADIEDLQVSEPPRPTSLHETIPHADPAIVQHAPPAYQSMGPPRQPGGVYRPQQQDIQGGGRTYDGGRRRVRTVAPPNIFRQNAGAGGMQPNTRGMFRRPRGRNVSFGALPNMNRSPRLRNRSIGGSSLKFDGDFDFEKANEEFSKLAEKLSTLDVNKDEEGSAKADQQQQQQPSEQHEEAAENQAVDQERQKENVAQPDEQQAERFYDKNKSFFDKISCEALEREKGEESRIRKSWQEERHQNAETFGASVNWSRFNQRYGGGGNRQQMGRRGPRPGGFQQGYRRVPFYQQPQQGEFHESSGGSSRMMEPLPTWYNDYTTAPAVPLNYQQQRMPPTVQRRGPMPRNPVYSGQPRRYPVYG